MKPTKRQVVYITSLEGPRGGRYWSLLLECGHTECRSQPAIHGGSVLFKRTIKFFLAPEQVLCKLCELGIEPSPETICAQVMALDLICPVT